jgi:hypothetical protein
MNEIHYCEVCEKMFDARPHAKFCSAMCRKRASRGGAKGAGSDYELICRLVYGLSPNKTRALVLFCISNLDDLQRAKLYGQIDTDFYRLKV